MRRACEIILSFAIGIIFGFIYFGTIQAHTSQPEPIKEIEYVYIEQEPEVVTETVYVEVEPELIRNFTEQEEWYLMDLAMRESEGEGVIGMLWVMYTVECRCETFNHTISEEWGSPAFETSMFRSGIEPNEDCLKALEIFREGWEPRPLYFGRNYYHSFATDLCQVGNHCFSSK